MTIIGNLLLFLSALIFLALNTGSLAKAPPGGDAAVGYAWSLILLNLAFAIIMIFVTIIIGYKGGFEWVSPKKSSRVLLVGIGMLAAVLTSGLCSLFKHEAGPVPALIRIYSSFAPVVIPLVLIIAGFVLLNSTFRNAVPIAAYKWPLVLISILGLTGTGSAVFGFISQSARDQEARIEGIRQDEDENHKRMLADIDSCDVMKNMVFILVFTGDNQDPDVHEKSVAKVKTNPQWQQELIRLIQTDWAPEPFQFLASNEVDDPQLFLEPVREGVLIQARLIRESIRNASHPSHFYPDQFSWEVERVLWTVDRFKGKGVDYLPAVKELRAAFNEPSDFEKPNWGAVKKLEEWIKQNG